MVGLAAERAPRPSGRPSSPGRAVSAAPVPARTRDVHLPPTGPAPAPGPGPDPRPPPGAAPVRLAAVGDLHLGTDVRGHLRPVLERVPDHADLFLLAGDLTRYGTVDEAQVVADEIAGIDVPIVAVLGNHDYHSHREREVTMALRDTGVHVLDGDGVEFTIAGVRVGVAGVKGFGGGFPGRCGTEFGEEEMKAFMRHSRLVADRLDGALSGLSADIRIALTHYAPIEGTLVGEPLEIYPFLGCYLLAEVIDAHDVSLALHGHAHRGTEKGRTPGGTRVRNVAQPVIGRAFAVYELGGAAA